MLQYTPLLFDPLIALSEVSTKEGTGRICLLDCGINVSVNVELSVSPKYFADLDGHGWRTRHLLHEFLLLVIRRTWYLEEWNSIFNLPSQS